MELVFYACVAVAGISLAGFGGPLARALGIIDAPDTRRKFHTSPTPLLGGVVLMGALLLAALFHPGELIASRWEPASLALLTVLFLVGLKDDRRHIPPMVRLTLMCVAFGLFLLAVPDAAVETLVFSFSPAPIGLGHWGPLFTLLCMVGLLNALNMADGKNCLVITISAGWIILLMGHAGGPFSLFAGPLLVTLVLLFPFNWREKLFLGDNGSYLLATFAGISTLRVYNEALATWSPVYADQIALVLLIPVADCVRLMVERLRRGVSPLTADREHLHHYLYGAMPWSWGLALYAGLTLVPPLVSLMYPQTTVTVLLMTLTAYAFIVWNGKRVDQNRKLRARDGRA